MITFPPEVDARAVLVPLRHGALKLPGRGPGDQGGSDARRRATRDSPLSFALLYLRHHLRDQVTGETSFSRFHTDMSRAARRWAGTTPARDIWVAPRGAAKTTWLFLILPLWALAHKHRSFFLAFSYTEDQARFHLHNLRQELADNDFLLLDFPELRPRRGANTQRTVLTGGSAFAARGLGGTVLGLRAGADRPDLIIGDDLEPDEADHTAAAKDKIVSKVINGILPMGSMHAVVQLAGTTTMHGSLIHDAVRAATGQQVAPWITGHDFTSRYYPPIDEHGRSIWPAKWSVEWLQAEQERSPQSYALNFANMPEQANVNGYWRAVHIRYDPRQDVVRRVLYVDPNMTVGKKGRDSTAIVLAGLSRDGRTAVIEHAEVGQYPGLELREVLWKITQAHPRTLHEWHVEGNQGGDRWREILSPIPDGVKLHIEHVRGSKQSRIEAALRHYQRGAVVHRAPLTALEDQQLAWTPAATKDDLLDADAGALRVLFPPGTT